MSTTALIAPAAACHLVCVFIVNSLGWVAVSKWCGFRDGPHVHTRDAMSPRGEGQPCCLRSSLRETTDGSIAAFAKGALPAAAMVYRITPALPKGGGFAGPEQLVGRARGQRLNSASTAVTRRLTLGEGSRPSLRNTPAHAASTVRSETPSRCAINAPSISSGFSMGNSRAKTVSLKLNFVRWARRS